MLAEMVGCSFQAFMEAWVKRSSEEVRKEVHEEVHKEVLGVEFVKVHVDLVILVQVAS